MYLDYASIRVRDLLRSLRFYARGLGLLEIRRGVAEHGGTWVLLEDPTSRQRIQLNYYPPSSVAGGRFRLGEELHHIAVRAEDGDALARRLEELGARRLEHREPRAAVDVIRLEDPDGIPIELLPAPGIPLATPLVT